MKFNFDREFMLKAFIVVVIFSFIFSTLWIGMSNNNNNNDNNGNNTFNQTEDVYLTGQGKVALILKEYSGVIELDKITDDSTTFINEGVKNGDVLYFNKEETKVSIVLSDKSKTYEYAKKLLENDSNVSIVLKARVYNDQKYNFTTDNGQVVSAIIPESEIRISYPYNIGEVLYYNALVQLLNGNVVGAQLYPLAKVEDMEMIFIVENVTNEYYSRLYFNWSDRELIRNYSSNLNQTLIDNGATNVSVSYVSDTTIYVNRSLYANESDSLREIFTNIKTIDMNKIIFYDNSTETEEEISDAVLNITNGTASLSFSPSMLELLYVYNESYDLISTVFDEINNKSIKKFHGVKAGLKTGDTNFVNGNSTYKVDELEIVGLIPVNKKTGDLIPLSVEATIQANTIVEAQQILDFSFE